MGAAWKNPPRKDFPKVLEMIRQVKALGLETCVTLGALDEEQVLALKEAGLDYYNHNLDTSPDFYKEIITTRTFEDRLTTINHVAQTDIKLCCGGILGMGETRLDRAQFLMALYQLPSTPKSIPINKLIAIKGTPLEHAKALDHFEFVKTIAIARMMFPQSYIRLSAGRESMSEAEQAWCYMAGANSIFIGDKLLTASNPALDQDVVLLDKLSIPHQLYRDEASACC
jgi:biotin synthase